MKKFILGIYLACTVIVAILMIVTLSFEEYEYTGSIWLARMFIPTAIVTYLYYDAYKERLGDISRRGNRGFLVPAVMSGCFFAFWIIFWLLEM